MSSIRKPVSLTRAFLQAPVEQKPLEGEQNREGNWTICIEDSRLILKLSILDLINTMSFSFVDWYLAVVSAEKHTQRVSELIFHCPDGLLWRVLSSRTLNTRYHDEEIIIMIPRRLMLSGCTKKQLQDK